MEDSRIVKRGNGNFLKANIGYAGDGAENRLEEENGKRTLLLDYSEFIVGIYETMPHWAPRDGEPINKKLRKRLSAVKLATHTGLGAKRKDYEQVPVVLDQYTVIIHHPGFIEVLIPVLHFSHQVFDILDNGTVKLIDLRELQYEFSLEFTKRWKSLILEEAR